ncbi:DUF4974 domain-containing protein [Fulvivirgaceae bacterium BMA12]|uniref:DUF4974 domain-containing protein n=1 Tax=Agaribacillus aureus TaxID=3051825 RepID=A0ABT8L7A7_9BACT|nr:DUF4974 domain-containing protein [Fulvivirgaceae bacterium BMA12]
MKKEDIHAIIADYLTNTISADDKEVLECWINESEENEKVFELLKNHWNVPDHKKFTILKSDELKQDIWARVNQQQPLNTGARKKKRFNVLIRYAAAVLILAVSISFIYSYLEEGGPEQEAVRLISKSNNAGRKSTIHLGDGTMVNLNSESRISYHEVFSDTARIIWLTGEAFFNVAHDPARPFYVISHNLKIKALGTSFNVSGYSDTEMVKVSLSTGKVSVSIYEPSNSDALRNKIELLPGQEVSCQKKLNVLSSVAIYDVIEVEGWKDGILHFKQAGLEEIIKKLERWYGIKIELDSQPANKISYSGIFEKQNLKNVLKSIGFVINFDFEINNKNVMLKFKNDEYE